MSIRILLAMAAAVIASSTALAQDSTSCTNVAGNTGTVVCDTACSLLSRDVWYTLDLAITEHCLIAPCGFLSNSDSLLSINTAFPQQGGERRDGRMPSQV